MRKKTKGLINGAIVLLLVLAAAGGGVWFFFQEADSEAEIHAAQSDLRLIWRGIREFQSEGYFARAPKSLEELSRFRFMAYIPKPAVKDQPSPGFSEIERNYSLIADPFVFLNPATGRQPQKGAFVSDYTLLSWYEPFLPDDAIIAWDNPGNFAAGGNLLFSNGRVAFYKMTPPEYRRFVKGLQTKSDREFVRKMCKEAAVSGFRKDPVED